ncbi:Teashirt 3 [Cichlidogyrus casuarinus]|uniref:Teashirt 3 n=1 Tax=Cichlidogyrus casuarinus TaxID=1844966 RepID=A0ABD2QBX3_9PLAT
MFVCFDTGHKPKSTPSDRDIPKLVRGQDMWINSETEQTREILRCMHCQQSFRTLPDLTMHMIATNHFSEIVYNEINSKSSASDTDKRRGEAIKRRCMSQTQKQSPHNESSDSVKDDASSKSSDLCAPDSTTTESLDHAQKVKMDSPDSKAVPRLSEEEDKDSKENPLSSLQKLVEFQQKSKPSMQDQNAQENDGLMNSVIKIFSHLSSDAVDDKNEAILSLKRLIEQEKTRSSQDNTTDNSMVNMLSGFLNFVSNKEPQETKKTSPRGSPGQTKVQTPTKAAQSSRPNFSTIPSNSQSSHIITSGITKKAKCHFCGKPFANKGQVRLHISKNKCPCLMQQQSGLANFGAMNGFGSEKSGSSPKDLDNVSKLGNPHLNAALELMRKQFNEPNSAEAKPKKEESNVASAFMGSDANSEALKARLNMMTLFSQALGLNASAATPAVPASSSSNSMTSNPLLGNFSNLFPLLNGMSLPSTLQSNTAAETLNASKLEKYLSLAKQLAVAQMFSSPELNFGVGK